jgi:hypothetical protein
MLWIYSRKVVDEMIVQIFRAILRLGYVATPDDVPLCEIPRQPDVEPVLSEGVLSHCHFRSCAFQS